MFLFLLFILIQEEKLKGRPGYEHLDDPLHILIEAELPSNVIDARLRHAQEIIEELLKPVVYFAFSFCYLGTRMHVLSKCCF